MFIQVRGLSTVKKKKVFLILDIKIKSITNPTSIQKNTKKLHHDCVMKIDNES